MAVLSCARDLAAAKGITAPILLLTDNAMLRAHLRAGLFLGFTTTPYAATHVLEPGEGRGKQALMSSFLDLALLSRAACLIGSPSGFSTVALLWGRHPCYLSIEQCMAEYEYVKPPDLDSAGDSDDG